MISVSDLLKWADEHAIGRSPSYPRGWISGKDLQMLSAQVEQNEPLNFYYSVRSNLAETGGIRLNCSECIYRVSDGDIGFCCGNGWSTHYGEYGVGGCEDYVEEESEAEEGE